MISADADGPFCSIERAVGVLGERWSFLILRETVLYRRSRFADIQSALGIATNVLTSRLESLVSSGLLEKKQYREPGARARDSYHPTERGESLKLVLVTLQQWGDENLPRTDGPTVIRQSVENGLPVRVGFMDAAGVSLDAGDVELHLAR
jgi:DNA-binding HxlR family transcriptional regulator